ncbi:MAG TPA: serine hydrolase [Thermoanaerobaculia bacterium]|nr:serine hydrolase [Thermoanaerobaculia bacterium]
MIRRGIAAAFALTIASTVAAQTQPLVDPPLRQALAARVESAMFPTLVAGIIDGDRQEIVSFGPANGETIYEIGSVTKTFTALVLADAVERGEVKLDTPVQQLLPGWTIPKSITLLDLATQSSGLPRLPENLMPKNPADPYADYTIADLKSFLASFHPASAPGTHYEYSNVGFGLLGEALAQNEGMSYADLVRARVTGPLAMRDTVVDLTPEMTRRFAEGHAPTGQAVGPWHFPALAGAGALRSTAHDLIIYLQSMMHPGKAAALATEPRRGTDQPNVRIALAWQIDSRHGAPVVWHNGMTGGYAAFVGFSGDRGAVVLTNVSHDVTDIGFALLGVPGVALAPLRNEVTLPAGVLAEYAGRYRLAANVDLVVTIAGGGLQVQLTGQGALPVFASAKDEFFYKAVNAQLSFHRDASGKVDSVTLHQNGRDLNAPRVTSEAPPPAERKEIHLDPATLAEYAGRYTLAPGFGLTVTEEGGQLYVQATAQPRLPVYTSARDEFFYKVVDAQLSFERDATGKVVAVVLHQNGRDLRGSKE